jgi:hypothetical protein
VRATWDECDVDAQAELLAFDQLKATEEVENVQNTSTDIRRRSV